MKEFKLFLLVIASSLPSILVYAQGATSLRTDRGVSLSYTREFYKKCKEITNREYNIYKITVYLSNNSGKSIKMADSWVSNKNPKYLNCISEYDNFGSMTFRPSGDLNASPEWDTRGKPWPSNSTLKGTYYIAVPVEDGEPPKPDWAMGGFAFVDDKKTNQAQPQWSEWKTDDCFSGLKYRVLGKEIYDLNRQYHYYFEFINEYKETIFFDFNLLDKNGKIRFGDRHTIRPGRNLAFNHKMTDNYITSFSTEKVCFKLDNKNYSPCLTSEEDKDKKNDVLAQKPVEEKKQDSKLEPSNNRPIIYNASSIETGEWRTINNNLNVKTKLIKVDEAIILMNSYNMEKGFAEVYRKISPEHYRYTWSEDTSAHCDIIITGTNKLDYYYKNYFQSQYKLTSALTPERSDWVYDISDNFKKIIIKIEDWLLDWDGKTSFAYYHAKTRAAEYRYKNVSRFDFIDDNKMLYTYGEPGKGYYYHRTERQKENSYEEKVSGSNCPENGKWVKPNSGGTFFINIECKGDDLSIKLFTGQTVIATKTPNNNPMFPGKTLWQCVWPTKEGGHIDELCTMVRGEDNVISIYWGLTNNNADWRMDFVRVSNENKTIGSNQNGTPTSSSSIAGTWNGDNGRSGTIVMASDGFTWTNQGESNGYLFKKTGTDTYRFDDGRNYCIVKFLSDTRLDYSCNGSHYAYFERRQ